MKRLYCFVLFISLAISSLPALAGQSLVNQPLAKQAADYYTQQKWAEAVQAYKSLAKQQPENYQAWYRLANSLIENKEGTLALPALAKASASPSIPPFLIAYQRAQAFKLSGNESAMWESLTNAVNKGYNQLATIEGAAIWSDIQTTEQFKELLVAVGKNAHPCTADSRFSEFDFWLGKWSVYGNTQRTGPQYGSNHISKQQHDCLVVESWVSVKGTTGTSMNYYDGTKDKWVQHWVSMGGTTINIEGGLKEGSMQLVGKIYYLKSPAPQIRDFRASWTPLENGVVRQYFEESVDGGKTWYTWFEGFYFPEITFEHSSRQ